MSFLGLGGKQNGAGAPVNKLKVEAAETEVDTVADMFNRLIDSCHKKCIQSYSDSDLTKQEGLCIDRCVFKYFEVNAKVGELMQSMGQQFQPRP
nr:Tim10 [Starmerella bombicola]